MLIGPDETARHYSKISTKLTPLARGVYSLLRRTGSLSALDAMRSPLGISSGSLTRRLTELRDAGFLLSRETKTDPVTGRRYARWNLTGVKKTPDHNSY